jgi:UDP-glucose 4-epimerase
MSPLKVVVTGASGFLGRYVLRVLAGQQHVEAIAVTRREISGWATVGNYSQSPPGDVLIHLAEDNDRARVAASGQGYEENVRATLLALSEKGYRRVVYASSAVLYRDTDVHAHFPDDPIRTDDAYTRVKRLSELAVLKLPGGVVARLANIYGPGMSKNNVMSTILRQIPKSGPVGIAAAKPVRDFIWVEDAAEGLVTLALSHFNSDNQGGLYNLGTGVGTSIGALANMVLEIAGQPGRPVDAQYSETRESNIFLDFSDTTSVCGWRPKTPLRQGLARLVNTTDERT